MSGAFTLAGGAVDKIREKITVTTPVVVAGSADYQVGVVWFQCNEIGGATPSLTVEIYDASTSTSYYLGINGTTYRAKALVMAQSVFFEAGIVLNPNEFLRITVSAADQVDVVGLSLLPNAMT